jgi:hypothetical protein
LIRSSLASTALSRTTVDTLWRPIYFAINCSHAIAHCGSHSCCKCCAMRSSLVSTALSCLHISPSVKLLHLIAHNGPFIHSFIHVIIIVLTDQLTAAHLQIRRVRHCAHLPVEVLRLRRPDSRRHQNNPRSLLKVRRPVGHGAVRPRHHPPRTSPNVGHQVSQLRPPTPTRKHRQHWQRGEFR